MCVCMYARVCSCGWLCLCVSCDMVCVMRYVVRYALFVCVCVCMNVVCYVVCDDCWLCICDVCSVCYVIHAAMCVMNVSFAFVFVCAFVVECV